MDDFQEVLQDFAGEFGLNSEADMPTGMLIDSDAKAEWAVRKIAAEEAECARLVACCQDEIDRYKARQEEYRKRLEGRTQNLKAMLLLYFGTVPTKETKIQNKYELPSGSLVMKKASRDFKADTDRLREWLTASGMNDYLKTEVSPRWAEVKKRLIALDNGDIVFDETGEVLPVGTVVIAETPARFEVKAK